MIADHVVNQRLLLPSNLVVRMRLGFKIANYYYLRPATATGAFSIV